MQPDGPDPASLDRLHDIVVPATPPWWPPAPGWIVVGLVLLAALAVVAVLLARRHRRRAYRRAGQAELRALAERARSASERDAALAELPVLVKRVALAAYPRDRVASLTGDDWLRFLDETCAGGHFARGPGRVLAVLAHDAERRAALTATDVDGVLDAADAWIAGHRVETAA